MLQAELLILKKEGDSYKAVTNEDPNSGKIYDILMTYQWPMCTAKLQLPKLDPKERLEISKSFEEDEGQFIQKKIQTLNKAYCVVFVPTVIYELFCLADPEIFDESQRIVQYALYLSSYPNMESSEVRKLPNISDVDVKFINLIKILPLRRFNSSMKDNATQKNKTIQAFIDINKDSQMQEFCFKTNDKFWKYLQEKVKDLLPEKLSEEFFAGEQVKEIINDLFTKIGTLNVQRKGSLTIEYDMGEPTTKFVLNKLTDPLISTLITSVVRLELEAKKAHRALLFRGLIRGTQTQTLSRSTKTDLEETTKPVVDISISFPGEGGIQLGSLSYGNSLFAGILRDTTASAFYYFCKNKMGYVVVLDKKEFAAEKLSKLFFVSPLTTHAAFCGGAELWHSRSKVVGEFPLADPAHDYQDGEENDVKIKIKGVSGVGPDTSGVIFSLGNPILHSAKLSEYIYTNAFCLFNEKDAGWKFTKEDEQIKGQKGVTDYLRVRALQRQVKNAARVKAIDKEIFQKRREEIEKNKLLEPGKKEELLRNIDKQINRLELLKH